ncbi:uncharacterized protein [Diabrotica undecimpunctata]|uniref:uncharacterized protein n=1 Tax=Diabrotica undecimpunctata TaxID=50387 RepID=UPI003B6328C3
MRCLRQISYDCQDNFPLESKLIHEDFYVDDLITGFDDCDVAKQTCRNISNILQSSGFNLRKWISNDPAIIEHLKNNVDELSVLNLGNSNPVKTLGIQWLPKLDILCYNLPEQQKIINTKRQILSEIAKVYDPLGLISPCIILVKILLQKLWKQKLNWDDQIRTELVEDWNRFKSKLHLVNQFQLNRFILTESHQRYEIHGFSDASFNAYSAVVYIRCFDNSGKITVRLLCSKTKVSPIKLLTIPRLELCGAVLLAKLMKSVIEAIRVSILPIYWCDSQIVLHWLHSDPSNLQVFVGNRISEIQRLSQSHSWHYVASKDNPADIASRGSYPHELLNQRLWWNGPMFLLDCSFIPPPFKQSDSIIIPEIKQKPISLISSPQLLLYTIRQQYWPTGGMDAVKSVVRNCITCHKFKPTQITPFMADLPHSRVTISFPFHHTGVDYAGPFVLKDRKGRGCKTYKAYICLFICFSTKAVHLELVTALTSEAFIATFRRFVARRGKPSHIFSDNRTNFVGAKNELNILFKFLSTSYDTFSNFFTNKNIQWHFIPSISPLFGGLWESNIKSVKHHLLRTIKNVLLTYEEFVTILTQIEATVNSRPLYPMSSDPNDFSPLTPSRFLIGRSHTAVPDLAFSETVKLNQLIRFQLLQQLQQSFWKQWSTSYLSSLQSRYKGKQKVPNLECGTLVTIRIENVPPCQWILGRISEVHPGPDGVVRVVTVRTSKGTLKRAVTKICPLPVLLNQPFKAGNMEKT